jgi:hypothetical protein
VAGGSRRATWHEEQFETPTYSCTGPGTRVCGGHANESLADTSNYSMWRPVQPIAAFYIQTSAICKQNSEWGYTSWHLGEASSTFDVHTAPCIYTAHGRGLSAHNLQKKCFHMGRPHTCNEHGFQWKHSSHISATMC